MPSVALYTKSLYSVLKETIGIEIVTPKKLLRSMIINFKENKKGAMNKITTFLI